MKQYEITAKLWIKVTANTQEEAQALSKTIVDEALIAYMQNRTETPGENLSISKAKTVWTKENPSA